MSPDLTDDKSTLVQVMAWCRQEKSHYLSQCWPRSLSPYGVIRPQWVKDMFKFLAKLHLRLIKSKLCNIVLYHDLHMGSGIFIKIYMGPPWVWNLICCSKIPNPLNKAEPVWWNYCCWYIETATCIFNSLVFVEMTEFWGNVGKRNREAKRNRSE